MHTRSHRGVDQDSVVVGAMYKMNQQFRFLLTSIAGSKCCPFSYTTVLPPHQHCRQRMSSFLTHYSSSFSPALQVDNVVLSHTLQIFLLNTNLPYHQHCTLRMSSFLTHYSSSSSPALQVANVFLSHTLQIFLLTSIEGSKCIPFSHTTVLPPHQHYRQQMSSFLTNYRFSSSQALKVASVFLSHILQFFLLTSIAGRECRPFTHTTVLPPHQHCRQRMLSFLTHYSSSSSPALQVANVVLSLTLL